VPQTSSNRIRAKDTSRAEARRRYKDEHRAAAAPSDADELAVAAATATAAPGPTSAFAMPNVMADLRALPQVLRGRWVWVPFVMLLAAFVLALLLLNEALPEGPVGDIATLYVSLTLPPTSLFVFFIGGFLASRASYLVGAVLGIIDALLISILYIVAPSVSTDPDMQRAGVSAAQADGASLVEILVPTWGIAILVGILAAGFAAWYKRFLRSSQERAKANRALREQEQARKAKEQARADKQAARGRRTT
jgi:hypothetical protein